MKTSSLALAAVLLAGVFSAPALATDSPSFDNDWYVTQLQQKGVDAVAAYEGAPGVVRAVVETANGQVFQYFDEDTLAPISANTGSNTRVLTKLDVGTKANTGFVVEQALSTTHDED